MNTRMLAVGAVLAASAAALAPSDAEACSCMPPSVEASWHHSSDTVAARVLAERRGPERVLYRVQVIRAFSGCLQPGDRITIETAAYDAACGQALEVGARYLLTADAADSRDDPGTYSIGLCGYNRRLNELTQADRDFLAARQVSCEETGKISCADGSDPVQCFQDPCDAERCAEATVCEANYCGGCDAEFYAENWAPVCEDPA